MYFIQSIELRILYLSMLDAELRPVFLFHPDFNEVIIPDSERRQQIHDCGSKGACNRADWVSTPLAAANLIPMQCMVEMREIGGNS
jgi:hypothetical protein